MTPHTTWTDADRDRLDTVIEKLTDEPGPLISVLQQVQAMFGHLPLEAMAHISRVLRIAPAHIFGVATFYAQFSFEPRGRHTILSCQGTACHVRGGATILEGIKRNLDVKEGGTTPDGRFTLERVYCVGCCSLAPAIIIDDAAFGKLTPDKTKKILSRFD